MRNEGTKGKVRLDCHGGGEGAVCDPQTGPGDLWHSPRGYADPAGGRKAGHCHPAQERV